MRNQRFPEDLLYIALSSSLRGVAAYKDSLEPAGGADQTTRLQTAWTAVRDAELFLLSMDFCQKPMAASFFSTVFVFNPTFGPIVRAMDRTLRLGPARGIV